MILETLDRLANQLIRRIYLIVFEPTPAQKRVFDAWREAIEKEKEKRAQRDKE